MIADLQMAYASTDAQHRNTQLMPQYPGITEEGLASLECMQIGSADPYGANPNQGFPGPRLIRRR